MSEDTGAIDGSRWIRLLRDEDGQEEFQLRDDPRGLEITFWPDQAFVTVWSSAPGGDRREIAESQVLSQEGLCISLREAGLGADEAMTAAGELWPMTLRCEQRSKRRRLLRPWRRS